MEGLKAYYPDIVLPRGEPGTGLKSYAIPGYYRFAAEWATIGTTQNVMTDVVCGAVGEDYKLVYNTAFVQEPSSGRGPSFHTDGPMLTQWGAH